MASWLQKIRSGPEHVKQRWLVGVSAVAMIFVVSIWLAYFNTILEPLGSADKKIVAAQKQESSAWDTTKLGAVIATQKAKGAFTSLRDALQTHRDYIIEP